MDFDLAVRRCHTITIKGAELAPNILKGFAMLIESQSKTDFIPMVKKPKFWIAPRTLRAGDHIEVDDEVGHQILAAYPGSFKVIAYGAPAVAAEPAQKRGRKPTEQKVISTEHMDTKDYSDILPEVTSV